MGRTDRHPSRVANLADLELHTYLAKAASFHKPTVLVFDLGIEALWVAMGGFMAARAVTLLFRFAQPDWQVLGARGT